MIFLLSGVIQSLNYPNGPEPGILCEYVIDIRGVNPKSGVVSVKDTLNILDFPTNEANKTISKLLRIKRGVFFFADIFKWQCGSPVHHHFGFKYLMEILQEIDRNLKLIITWKLITQYFGLCSFKLFCLLFFRKLPFDWKQWQIYKENCAYLSKSSSRSNTEIEDWFNFLK